MKLQIRIAIFFFMAVTLSSVQGGCFTIAKLKYGGGGDWYSNPSSLPNLIKAIKRDRRINICDSVKVVAIEDPDFFSYPFIYLTGHGNIHFTESEKIRLRKFLENGGFLWADDNYGLDKSFRREMKELFPENPLIPLPDSHPIYNSRYKLQGLPKIHEHDGEPAQGFAVFFKKRMVVFYTFSSDIGDGMESLEVHNDGEELHRIALQMGVNVVYWYLNN